MRRDDRWAAATGLIAGLCLIAVAAGCGGEPPAEDAAADASDIGAAIDADGAADGGAETATGGPYDALGDAGPSDAAVDAASDAVATPIGPAVSPLALIFGPAEPWQQPLTTWQEATAGLGGEAAVEAAITALTRTAAGVLIGYGSLGRKISPEQAASLPAAEVLALDVGTGAVTSLYQSFDAALRRHRLEPDGTIYAPGGRPLAIGKKGSLYRYPPGGPWQRFETVPEVLWLHDARAHGGALYLAGSAAEQAKGDHHAALWRSDDGGGFFEIVSKNWNGSAGAAELRWLVVVGDALVALGRKTDAKGAVKELPHIAWSIGAALPLPPSHPLKTLLPEAVVTSAAGDELIGGEDLLSPGKALLLRVSAGATTVAALDAAAGTLVAGHLLGPGEDAAGAATPALTLLLERLSGAEFRVRALAQGAAAPTTLWTGASNVALTAVAFGHGALVFGTADGRLLRAAGAWKP